MYMFVIFLGSWKKRNGEDPSNSGTTVTCAIFQYIRMFIANVGDSAAVLGKVNPKHKEPGQPEIIAKVLTKKHTPMDPSERDRIEKLGGSVVSSKGSMRVVWKRKRPLLTNGEQTNEKSCDFDYIPKLNMTRSLGDLWSTTEDNEYLISPIPHVHVHEYDFINDRFIILGTDGLWNVITPQESVETVYHFCQGDVPNDDKLLKALLKLIDNALEQWSNRKLVADNVSAVVGTFRPSTGELRHTDKGIDLHVSMPSPCGYPLNENLLQTSTPLDGDDDKEFSDKGRNSLQTSWKSFDLANHKLGKQAEKECPSVTSPVKHFIMAEMLNNMAYL